MSTSSIFRLLVASLAVAILSGCAHPIVVSAEKTPERVESILVPKRVAYAITDVQRSQEVTTEGGGGDRISYYPYKDLEKAIRESLRSVYAEVVAVRSAADRDEVQQSGATLVFAPEIKTTSSSQSALTWPPTRFSTEIACKVTDPSGQEVAQVKAIGSGSAEFDEFKSNFGLAAARAGSDVASKLSTEIKLNPKLR